MPDNSENKIGMLTMLKILGNTYIYLNPNVLDSNTYTHIPHIQALLSSSYPHQTTILQDPEQVWTISNQYHLQLLMR